MRLDVRLSRWTPARACALVATLGLAAWSLAGCSGTDRLRGQATPDGAGPGGGRPLRRTSGPRLPAPFGGVDPSHLGLRRVEGLLWLREEEAAAWPAGGLGLPPPANALPGSGLLLRTDHVALSTDLPAARALPLAHVAQRQVERLMTSLGVELDLRLPREPLSVVVFARRADFDAALRASVPEPTGWNAFYDARDGTVRVCAEPAATAALPLNADLKHELTHAVLDLSAAFDVPHERILAGMHFWLWEGIAVFAETLDEAPGTGSQPLRRERLVARARRGELTALAEFVRLDQERFEGRHYDQAASVMQYLMADPALRQRTLDLLRRLLRGDVLRHDVERDLGLPVGELEARWRTAAGLGAP